MEESSGRPSPRRQLQGPRPPRLTVSKESRTIKKPPVPPQAHHARRAHQLQPNQQQQQQQPPQPRAPVIIYDASPKVIHTEPSKFMALVQRLTGQSHSDPYQPQPADDSAAPIQPDQLLLSPTAALSPAARLAAIEKSVRPMRTAQPESAQFVEVVDDYDDMLGPAQPAGSSFPGILSPLPSSLPPAVSAGLFSPMPFDPSCITWLNELSPILAAAAAGNNSASGFAGWGGGNRGFDPFLASPRNLLATPTVPSPATCMELFSHFPDL